MTQDERPEEPESSSLWDALRMIRGKGETKQLGTHISKDIHDLLGEVAKETGLSKRVLVEFAIRQAYGTREGRKLWQEK